MGEHSFAMKMGKCPLQVRRRMGLQMTLDGYGVLLGRLRMNGDYISDRLKEGGRALGSRSGGNVVERPLGNYTPEPLGP